MQWSVDLHPVTGEWRIIGREGEIVCVSLHGEQHLAKIGGSRHVRGAGEGPRVHRERHLARLHPHADANTADPAHGTLPAIEAALAKASNGEAVDG
ncbi:hypothetical protein [Bosea sp. (in: a-proteobacteria)]|jgi:hypothetical protein|uniref:hypothetical protein n=1 Tax=Bosea sp. (in: a-proteobacteria) TaxID=1871050 RepID=UPI002DDD5195|nr:hypothetical protein [Bosea sp. (in: a-proteobacteria)]HEV2510141.1 hypothetical protein [Bosea sp. (in: a-proteobacteria)]